MHTGSLAASCHVESSQIRDGTQGPALAGGFLATLPPGKSRGKKFLSFFLKTILSPGSRTVAMHSRSLINVAVCMYI